MYDLDFSTILESRDQIMERFSHATASYSIISTKLKFNSNFPGTFKIPYNLSDKEFRDNFSEIRKALTYFHELCHYFQALSTTNGIIEFLYAIEGLERLVKIQQKANYKLPLKKHFNELLKGQNISTAGDIEFLKRMIEYKFSNINNQWLCGDYLLNNAQDINNNFYKLYKSAESFFVAEVRFFDQRVDELYGIKANKFLGIFKCQSPQENRIILTPIGTLQLSECFAKSIEFEHLIWFNKHFAQNIINAWLFDDEVINYNSPVRLWLQEPGLKVHENLPFFWAHMRLFIDLSLMYSDFLFLDDESIKNNDFDKKLYALKVQPGITYFEVLKAFRKLKQLENHEDDILRLYTELCDTLGIPRPFEMLERLRILLGLMLEYTYKDSLLRPYLEISYKLVEHKLKNPLLFLNNLIHVDKFNNLINLFKKYISIYTPVGFAEREDFPTILFETVKSIYNQVVSNDSIYCPIVKEYEICLKPNMGCKIRDKKNVKVFQKNNECCPNECFVGNLVNAWYINQKQE